MCLTESEDTDDEQQHVSEGMNAWPAAERHGHDFMSDQWTAETTVQLCGRSRRHRPPPAGRVRHEAGTGSHDSGQLVTLG